MLPGVKAIGWVDSRNLPRRVDLSGIVRVKVLVLTDVHPVDFFGHPDCSCRTEKSNGGYQDTASLKFSSPMQLPDDVPLSFVVTDIAGDTYLIGSLEHPWPKVKCETVLGTPSGDPAGYSYEITHVSIKSMVPCVI